MSTTNVHTAHPCGADGCTSSQQYVLTDPNHEGTPGFDAVRAHWFEYAGRWSYSLVSRTFGAETFATRDEAEQYAARVPFEVVPTPWGTRHASA